MTIIAQSIKTVFATVGLVCVVILALFFGAAYSGNGERIAQPTFAIWSVWPL